ncbi:hypothetical protein ACS0YX_32640, partial [Burkholderia gladioli]|uniref:hypothetical protein n=1 Tax=Burkholderia gladioli TaxID=28095 RepID=UPI003F7B30EB
MLQNPDHAYPSCVERWVREISCEQSQESERNARNRTAIVNAASPVFRVVLRNAGQAAVTSRGRDARRRPGFSGFSDQPGRPARGRDRRVVERAEEAG